MTFGYLMHKDAIIGQVRNYDYRSDTAEILLYSLDLMGYVPGKIESDWTVMEPLLLDTNPKLRNMMNDARYKIFQKANLPRLIKDYDSIPVERPAFDEFCREMFHVVHKEVV